MNRKPKFSKLTWLKNAPTASLQRGNPTHTSPMIIQDMTQNKLMMRLQP